MTSDELSSMMGAVRRSLWLSSAVKIALLAVAAMAIVDVWRLILPLARERISLLILVGAAGAWMALTLRGANSIRLINAAATYVAGGRPDLAEEALAEAARQFGLVRAPRLLALQNLASLAHGRGRFDQCAQLCRFLVEQSGRSARKLHLHSRLLLADSELMQGNLPGAYGQLTILHHTRLALADQLALLPTACYYEVSAGRWDLLAAATKARAELGRLLPAPQAAATLGCLALGCQNVHQLGQRDWLWKQTTLLLDRDVLIARLPLLAALPADAVMALPWQGEQHAAGECR